MLIYVHKEEMLDDIERRYPAGHYVMVDDKLRILTAMKAQWQDRLTTVFVRQGHYALDPSVWPSFPPADVDHRVHCRSGQAKPVSASVSGPARSRPDGLEAERPGEPTARGSRWFRRHSIVLG